MAGLFMVLPVMVLYSDLLPGATPLLMGLALGIYGLTQALLQIPFGILSDRIGRRPLIAAGLLLLILGSVVAAMAETVHGVILGRALQGAGAALVDHLDGSDTNVIGLPLAATVQLLRRAGMDVLTPPRT